MIHNLATNVYKLFVSNFTFKWCNIFGAIICNDKLPKTESRQNLKIWKKKTAKSFFLFVLLFTIIAICSK